MKKMVLVLLIAIFVLSTFNVQAGASGEQPMFLLGQNEKAEVIISGKATSLELGKNPIQLLTGSSGQKLVLCAGETTKAGEIKQGASLRLLTPDLRSYEKTVQCNSSLTAYTINSDLTTIWLATRGGFIGKEAVKPQVYRVSLDSLEVAEIELDSIPCEINLSGDGKRLAVAELGGAEIPNSVLKVFEAGTLDLLSRFDIAKNPGMMTFSNDDTSLIVAGYGYQNQEGYRVPTEYSEKLNQPVPAGAAVIDLASLESKVIELGAVNREFIAGENATVYALVKAENSGVVKAIGPGGLLWEKKFDYVPQYIQERPETSQVWVIGGEKMSIIEKQTGNIVKELTAQNDLNPFLFLDNTEYAYGYNMKNRKLHILNLDNLEIEKTLAAGSTGLALMKTLAVAASFAEYSNSLQPQYVNGVRMPTRVSQIYWVHSPKGNIVACPEKNKLYMLNSFLAEIYTYDLQKGIISKKLGYLGEKTMYLQMAPNGKYVILASGDNWKLINVGTDKADLTFNPSGTTIRLAFQEVTAPTPYFSPDGNRMYIPNNSKITVIDLQKGKKLENLKSDTKDAMVCW